MMTEQPLSSDADVKVFAFFELSFLCVCHWVNEPIFSVMFIFLPENVWLEIAYSEVGRDAWGDELLITRAPGTGGLQEYLGSSGGMQSFGTQS